MKTIRSVGELAQLPNLSVVRFHGRGLGGRLVWQLDEMWFSPGSVDSLDATGFPTEAFPAVVLWSPKVRITKTCWRCGRVGKKQFGAAASSESVGRWECSNVAACQRRSRPERAAESYSRITNLAGANARRASFAAQRRAEEARSVLALLERDDSSVVLPSNAAREQWIAALRLRANDETASLRDLAAAMSPPMSKDRYTGLLRRACRLAAAVPPRAAPKPTKLATLIDSAAALHSEVSVKKLALIAQQNGYPICGETLRMLRDRPIQPKVPSRRGPTRHVIRAIAFLAQVPESVVREAAGVPAPDEKKRSEAVRLARVQRDYQRRGQALTLDGAVNRRQTWTTGEDQLMLAYMRDPAARINDLARGLGRSRAAVTNRLQEIRSKRTETAVQTG